MGYREYFVKVEKQKIKPLREMNKEQLIEWSKNKNIKVEEDREYVFISINDILDVLNAKSIYGFGKYYENAEEIIKLGEPLFKDTKLDEEMFYDYNLHIVGKEAVLSAIEWQRKKILNHFETLLLSDEEYNKIDRFNTKTREERLLNEVKHKISEWSSVYSMPYNISNKNKEEIVNSWLYEYTIWDLVRIYKDTDWENECIIFYGY